MKKVACLAVLAAILPGAALAADCVYPKQPPKPPNGNRAARSEMVAAMKVNNKYQADIKVKLTRSKQVRAQKKRQEPAVPINEGLKSTQEPPPSAVTKN